MESEKLMQQKLSTLSRATDMIFTKPNLTQLPQMLQDIVNMTRRCFSDTSLIAIYKIEGMYHKLICSAGSQIPPAECESDPALPDITPVLAYLNLDPEHKADQHAFTLLTHNYHWGSMVVTAPKGLLVEQDIAFLLSVSDMLSMLIQQTYESEVIKLQYTITNTLHHYEALVDFCKLIVKHINIHLGFDTLLLTHPNAYAPSEMTSYMYDRNTVTPIVIRKSSLFTGSVTSDMLISRKRLIINDFDPERIGEDRVLESTDYASVMRIPVTFLDSTVAVLHLYSKRKNRFRQKEASMLENIIAQFSSSIHHFVEKDRQLMRQMFKDVADRVNDEIMRSNDHFVISNKIAKMSRRLFKLSNVYVWLIDEEQFRLRNVKSDDLNMGLTESATISSVLFHKKSVYCSNIEDLGVVSVRFNHIPAKSALFCPLIDTVSNNVNGIVVLVDSENSYRFHQELCDLCDQLITPKGTPLSRQMKNRNLERSHLAIIKALTIALDKKDSETEGHSERVVLYSTAIANRMDLQQQSLKKIRWGALLHDIGKIGIPDAILLKPGKLFPEEWEVMKTHPMIGFEMMRDIEFLEGSIDIVLYHHERWDGQGYPHGLRGDEIPLGARIFAIADTFDAITSDRPYRKAQSIETAIQIVSQNIGTQFCPASAKAFLSIPKQELEDIRTRNNRKSLTLLNEHLTL